MYCIIHLEVLRKQKLKPKFIRWKEMIKIKAEINERETSRTRESIVQTVSYLKR